MENTTNKHVDEMTLLMYVERQLDRASAQEVSVHTQTCTKCMTLLRALDRESRLLTRALLEQDEPLPARLAEFHERVKRSMQWIWGVVFGLAVLGVYALYSGYIEPWQQQLEQAGFSGTNLLNLLIFQGAFWKGWESMFSLLEVFAFMGMAAFAIFAFRKYLRRGSAVAVMFASLGLLLVAATPASAQEKVQENVQERVKVNMKGKDSVEVKKDEILKRDLFFFGDHLRVNGTVDGDVIAFAHQIDVTGHVSGDVICFAQTVRISGQVDGNVRSISNNMAISGNVDKSVSVFNEVMNFDANGKVGRSLSVFTQTATIDGKIDRDFRGFFKEATISGTIGGDMSTKGESLTIAPSAQIDGHAKFEGDNAADVASGAKLASPLEFKKLEHKSHAERGAGHYVWRLIWTGTFILLGIVLFGLMPKFSQEAVEYGEHYGGSFGLGVLVFFGVFIAAIIVCFTVIGLFVGISTLFLWIVTLLASEVVVGTIVGQWVMGRTAEYWPMVLRMVVGIVLVRIVTSIPFIGGWAAFVVGVWGMGAISLALYRRLQPVIAPGIPSMPMAPAASPLPPNTTVGGI